MSKNPKIIRHYTTTPFGRFALFNSPLNTWNGEFFYKSDRRELNRQITHLLTLQGGLAQTSQGQSEDKTTRQKMEDEAKMLKKSIVIALGIKPTDISTPVN